MEKSLKIVKVISILLIAILVSLIAFGGINLPKKGLWKNILKDFQFGMELEGYRELHFALDDSEEEKEVFVDAEGNYKGTVKEESTDEATETENQSGETGDVTAPEQTENTATENTTAENATAENTTDGTQETNSVTSENTTENSEQQNIAEEAKVEEEYKKETRTIKANEEEDINIDNFEKSKKLIQKRLESISQYEYNIRQDSVTGEIIVELPDNNNFTISQSLISTAGNLEIIDYQTGLILLDKSYINSASAIASAENNQYQAYLQLEFNKEGKEILNKISKEYIESTSGDGTSEKKYVSVNLDDQTIIRTYFGDELDQGILQIPIGNASTNYDEYIESAQTASRIAYLVNNETLPLNYKLSSDNFIKSTLIEQYGLYALIVSIVVLALISIYLIIKFKFKGFYAAVLDIGYIAILTLAGRYMNVLITLNSLVVFVLSILINYIFTIKVLNYLSKNESKKSALLKSMKELYISIIPICIVAIVFTFMSSVVINSIGMTLFWGLFVQAICSLVVLI